MKFNKLTHFMIIVFLAVTFIVVYLYYTIKDVKKISTEVQKLSKEVLALSQSISSITTTLINQAPVCYTPSVPSAPSAPSSTQTVPQASSIQVTVQEGIILDDESDNVDDLHQIIETIDDENAQAPGNVDILQLNTEDAPQSTEQELTKPTSKLDAKDLKSLSYETLKKYCKENGIDAKGNKETLISKILAS